jgi:hypothetical protein
MEDEKETLKTRNYARSKWKGGKRRGAEGIDEEQREERE